MRKWSLGMTAAIGLAAAMVLATPKPAEALIHEIIAALCRVNALGEVQPHGQATEGLKSFVRALTATGFITSVDTTNPTMVVINFDPTVPNSKFVSAGFDLVIPDGIAPGVDLVLSPLVVPDEDFAAHAHCRNLN